MDLFSAKSGLQLIKLITFTTNANVFQTTEYYNQYIEYEIQTITFSESLYNSLTIVNNGCIPFLIEALSNLSAYCLKASPEKQKSTQ